jgi:hypothetical protein
VASSGLAKLGKCACQNGKGEEVGTRNLNNQNCLKGRGCSCWSKSVGTVNW